MTQDPGRPFGRLLTAMITPFGPDGGVDLDGAQRLATHLVEQGDSDGLVISGTTGESPTTSDQEKDRLLRAVCEAVGDRARIVAGVGSNDTAHTVELATAAQRAGAHGLLVVSPYYSKPPQSGLLAHFATVADATDLPVMVYDIPARTGVAVAPETMARLAEHPRILGVKDAKDDLAASSWVLAHTDLAYYSGTDLLNLPLLSIGAVGFVSVVSHLAGPRLREMIDQHDKGDVARARDLHRELLPLYQGVFRAPNPILVKAALQLLGLPAGAVRLPLVDATGDQVARLRDDLAQGGVVPPAGSTDA
ncbi:MAG TPA: 4-hydroxy-tetrahydrodipicolinate synthase [Mycobacteriales bacterium]|nr:4-hydroxy-tetrahydrodipicolinate synthase [Mycobacteriales bacterium]